MRISPRLRLYHGLGGLSGRRAIGGVGGGDHARRVPSPEQQRLPIFYAVATVNNVRVSGRDQVGFGYFKPLFLFPFLLDIVAHREYPARVVTRVIAPPRGEQYGEPLVKVFTDRVRPASTARFKGMRLAFLCNTVAARYVR